MKNSFRTVATVITPQPFLYPRIITKINASTISNYPPPMRMNIRPKFNDILPKMRISWFSNNLPICNVTLIFTEQDFTPKLL
jgi:hypothetical protein